MTNYKADTLGIVSSVLCLIHCLLLPLLVLGGMMSKEWGVHTQWMDYLFIILAVSAVFLAARQMQSVLLKRLMWTAVFWFGTSILLHDISPLALYSSMLASLVLVVLHAVNFRQHHQHHTTKKATA